MTDGEAPIQRTLETLARYHATALSSLTHSQEEIERILEARPGEYALQRGEGRGSELARKNSEKREVPASEYFAAYKAAVQDPAIVERLEMDPSMGAAERTGRLFGFSWGHNAGVNVEIKPGKEEVFVRDLYSLFDGYRQEDVCFLRDDLDLEVKAPITNNGPGYLSAYLERDREMDGAATYHFIPWFAQARRFPVGDGKDLARVDELERIVYQMARSEAVEAVGVSPAQYVTYSVKL